MAWTTGGASFKIDYRSLSRFDREARSRRTAVLFRFGAWETVRRKRIHASTYSSVDCAPMRKAGAFKPLEFEAWLAWITGGHHVWRLNLRLKISQIHTTTLAALGKSRYGMA